MSMSAAEKTLDEADKGLKAALGDSLTAEEERALDGDEAIYGDGEDAPVEATAVPDWAVIPPGLKMPPGRQIYFVRFRAGWTDRPSKGERQCILWNLTESEEKHALRRTRGDALRAADELAKQMVRAIDGKPADWTGAGGAGSVQTFWDEIGGKCRQLLKGHYAKTHMLDTAETADFFASCVAVRTAQP
jgi:hypothetical protein